MPPSAMVCGVRLAPTSPSSAAIRIVDAARTRQALEVHPCNAYTLSLVDSDPALRVALDAGDLNLPDGTPVAWMLRGHGAAGPVRGADLLEATIAQGVPHGLRHYFYGGHEGVAEAAISGLRKRHADLAVAGSQAPPFHDLSADELQRLVGDIESSRTDVVWIGLGTPRQDYLVHELAKHLSMPLVPIGAVFDYEAGRVHPPPQWLQGSGLEWLYRLVKEPRRLWRRYLLGNPRFLRTALRHRMSRAHSDRS